MANFLILSIFISIFIKYYLLYIGNSPTYCQYIGDWATSREGWESLGCYIAKKGCAAAEVK